MSILCPRLRKPRANSVANLDESQARVTRSSVQKAAVNVNSLGPGLGEGGAML